ncbi:putative epoxide hydrolase [Mycena pura]|uniref:Epoxide hydrolase n=1 Tax=Mycena pura TaxID=153505 RepID=A0AAD6Y6J3_9AGAR|nr:putative epoxide hydrolase [Mycena pura]
MEQYIILFYLIHTRWSSWRRVIGPLADAGYHAVAPDQRGYGRTASAHAKRAIEYEDDLAPFRMTNLVKDMVALVYALGYRSAAAVVGHDFGSTVAAYCALIRPDVFRSVVMMSGPFTGPPKLAAAPTRALDLGEVAEALAALRPPRKHYRLYYSTRDANAHMMHPPDGLHAFLRRYFHVKSADWAHNAPRELARDDAAALGALPHYYVMPLGATMPEAVQGCGPSAAEIARNAWLPEAELGVYAAEFARTGFQGGLNAYRVRTSAALSADCALFDGMRVEVPALFVAGRRDWGAYQFPGAVDVARDLARAIPVVDVGKRDDGVGPVEGEGVAVVLVTALEVFVEI